MKNVYGFNNDTTDKLEQLYNRLGQKYSDDNDLMLSWRYTRLLSSFVYSGDLWDETAGEALKNTGYSDVDLYFVEFLDFDKEEYDDLKKLIIDLHKENKNNLLVIGDFAHMMYSLSARLAYYLNVDGLVADIAGVFVGEDISYLAGWLGDAVLTDVGTNGTTSFGNDDYICDLDAENIYRLMIQNSSSVIDSMGNYYENLSDENTRAVCFLEYIDYETVKNKVYYHLVDRNIIMNIELANQNNDPGTALYWSNLLTDEAYHVRIIYNGYPDTYDFLRSLQDKLNMIGEYKP